MSDGIIDARRRFRGAPTTPPTPEEIAEQWAERSRRQEREATELRERLAGTPRLHVDDRKILVRNLGRAIERKHSQNPKQISSQLFLSLFGEEGGLSKDKKRKRYIRFDGESLNDHAPGEEYAANGPEFLRLIEGLADLIEPHLPRDLARNQMLLFICNGASFYGRSRPRLIQGQSLSDTFRNTTEAVIDRISRETDIVEYLKDIQNYTIRTHPHSRDECSEETLANLHKQCCPVERFEHLPTDDAPYDEYSRLRLGGFDIRGEEPSPLYPRMRLARIYWPREVLCLPSYVSTTVLEEIRTRPLSDAELSEALAAYKSDSLLNRAEGDLRRLAIREWRDAKEYEMWRAALRDAGYDPDTIDWRSFEDELDGSAINGAEWRTFWQTANVDLRLVADGKPEALHFGLSFGGGISHWTHAPKELVKPADDDDPGSGIGNCVVMDESMKRVPWMPAGERTYVCRGFFREYWRDLPSGEEGFECDEFEDAYPPYIGELLCKELWPLQADEAWHFLTLRMKDWRASHFSSGSQRRDDSAIPSLRPHFDAPDGWAPAPDGSIASAILRSLAYGEGKERLDEKFIGEVNNLVRCYRDMKDELLQSFEAALSRHGYGQETRS